MCVCVCVCMLFGELGGVQGLCRTPGSALISIHVILPATAISVTKTHHSSFAFPQVAVLCFSRVFLHV